MAIARLGLDLGANLGWALRRPDGTLTHGVERLASPAHRGPGYKFLAFRGVLQMRFVEAGRIDEIAFEDVAFKADENGVRTSQVYGGYVGNLMAWCEAKTPTIPYRPLHVGTIKKHITGSGKADKPAMMAALRKLGHTVRDPNESDALAVLLLAESEHPLLRGAA